MEVDYFQIVLIDVTFFLKHIWKLVILCDNKKHEYNRDRRLKGYRLTRKEKHRNKADNN